jgi:pimeloyl-ACP methyl ester carboxylesterase
VQLRDPSYAGGVSVAGYMDFESWASDEVLPDPEGDLYWAFEAFGIKASYPSFEITRMLTPAAMSRYHDATTKGCYYYAYAAYKELGRQLPAHADWAKAPEARKYLHDSQSADKEIFGPLLVVAGDDDRIVPLSSVVASVRHACGIGLAIEFLHRPGLDHDAVMYDTTPTLLAWARDRLSGKPWAGNCESL